MNSLIDALVAGGICGTLMGLFALAHISVLLVFRPPTALLRRAGQEGVANKAMATSLSIAFCWGVLGVALALVFVALEAAAPSTIPSVPSAAYLAVVFVLVAVMVIPASFVLSDRLTHLGIQAVVFVGIFGWLIPNLVMAQRN